MKANRIIKEFPRKDYLLSTAHLSKAEKKRSKKKKTEKNRTGKKLPLLPANNFKSA